jgi:hypothetical protein
MYILVAYKSRNKSTSKGNYDRCFVANISALHLSCPIVVIMAGLVYVAYKSHGK